MSALLPLLDGAAAGAESRALLAHVHATMGHTPNLFKAMAHSPAATRSLSGSISALAGGQLGRLLAEKIALAVANRNGCDYCLGLHRALARRAGASLDDVAAAQRGEAPDAYTQAVLQLALELVEERGRLSPEVVHNARVHGLTDALLVEVLAHVALNLFTNYVSVALRVPAEAALA